MSIRTVFITGAAGFVGFHLALALSERGDKVVGLDNFNDYYDPQLKRRRAEVLAKRGIQVIEGDICDGSLLDETVTRAGVTHLVHLAAQAGVRYSLEAPLAYVKSNLEGFVNILELCRHHPEIPLVYASSSSVYGLNTETPFKETDMCDRPASLYGATKKSNELLAHSYHHLYGIRVAGLRFFTVYGPWGRPDMAYYGFTEKMLNGNPIDVYNHGKMARDFTYIDDIVNGIAAAVDLAPECEVFNLGNSHPEKLGTMIELLEDAIGRPADKRYLPMQPGDVVATYADISHSHKMLGYKPQTSLKNGLALFAQWYRLYQEDPQAAVNEWACEKSAI